MADDNLADIPISVLAKTISITSFALHAEGVDSGVIERVKNRLVWGDPQGYPDQIVLDTSTVR